jgi:IS30 family transposase
MWINVIKAYSVGCHKQLNKCDDKFDWRGIIANRRSIDVRPGMVETRVRVADWEADNIIGQKHKMVIVSLVEANVGIAFLQKMTYKTADKVNATMLRLTTHLK